MANVSKMQRFPILRLPILAIDEVLITMNPFELINFSMCNPTTKCIAKLFFRKKRGFEILLGNSSTLSIAILGSQKRIWKYHIINDESAEIPESIYEVAIRYSENVFEEWKFLLEYLDDLMNFKAINDFYFDLDDFPDLNQPVIECIKTWNKPVKCEPTIINVPFGIAITRNDGKVGRMFLETFGNRLFLVFMVF
ncbi:hypothetical protein CAEBREN_16065 [Caenorhabditis brenneri]|uniref:F-box domain-containing protein n=1 Tax=Caenorhabditis brenneri TaxID=135651 RepID=G0P3Q0_CAEBE|nr:hypothetical protein CAEBREN_16065 [Caenorhabditis brenneri]